MKKLWIIILSTLLLLVVIIFYPKPCGYKSEFDFIEKKCNCLGFTGGGNYKLIKKQGLSDSLIEHTTYY